MTLSFLPYHAPSTLALSLSLSLPNSVASIYRLACIPLLRQLPRRNKLTKFPPPSSIHRASSPRSSSSPGWIPALLVPHLETRTRGAKTKEENNEEKKIKKEERETPFERVPLLFLPLDKLKSSERENSTEVPLLERSSVGGKERSANGGEENGWTGVE